MDAVEQELRPLMLLGLAGDTAAQRRLLQGCAERLRSYYRRRLVGREADAEDLVQETLIAIHQRRASYDIRQPFTAWLHAIARYKLIDFLRASTRRRTMPIGNVDQLLASEDPGEAFGAAKDVASLLATLPSKQEEAIRLTKLDGYSVEEAAAMTGQSPSGIKVGVHRGLKALAARARDTKH